MVSLGGKTVEGLVLTAEARRSQAPVRLFIALVLAISFHRHLSFFWLWAWLGAYVLAQGLEVWALWPFRSGAPIPSRGRTRVAFGSIFTLAAVFGAIAIPLWLMPSSLGPAGAVLLLAGGMLNVLGLSRGSPIAFASGAIPYASYLIAAPLIDRQLRGSNPLSGPFLLAALVFLVAAVIVFRTAERLAWSQARAHAELESRRANAEANAEAKATFAAMVSHELRTPLSAILAAAAEIQRRAGEPEVRERAALINQGGRMMRALLDDLLDLSKLEANRMRVEQIPFDLPLLIEDVALFWSSEAHRKGLSLSLHGAQTLPPTAEGDPMRLRQIFNNLLSNAVKFTDAGEVRIEVASREVVGDRIILKVCVADTGAGMGPDRLARIFQAFDQGDDSVARTHGGTGLGLVISRELARLMGGDLTVESEVGRGSRFTLLTTLGRATPQALGAAAAFMADPQPTELLRILAVDDHEIGRMAMGLLLEPLGAEVALAAGGQQALDLLAVEVFDLVLMDVTMTGMDGLEACRRLRDRAGPNRDVPVLAVTGHAGTAAAETCLAAGMDGWVAKPVEARSLYDAIDKALRDREIGTQDAAA